MFTPADLFVHNEPRGSTATEFCCSLKRASSLNTVLGRQYRLPFRVRAGDSDRHNRIASPRISEKLSTRLVFTVCGKDTS